MLKAEMLKPEKPPQCDIKATTKRVDRQPIAIPKPPQCDPNAILKLHQCDLKTTYKPAALEEVATLKFGFSPAEVPFTLLPGGNRAI